MRKFYSAAQPEFSCMTDQTYAAYPVWKGSTTEEIRFEPLPKRQAVQIFHHARRFERMTGKIMCDASGRISRQGRVSRMGILVLHALLFDFLNYRSGRLDPSYAAIAKAACVSVRSVARALVRLKACGILNWVRRCVGTMDEKRFVLEQETNAYGLAPATQWRGYRPPADPPRPDPGTWGDHPNPGTTLALAAEALRAGAAGAARRHLESDPSNKIALGIARLGRSR